MSKQQEVRDLRKKSIRIPLKTKGHQDFKAALKKKGVDMCSFIRLAVSERLAHEGIIVEL